MRIYPLFLVLSIVSATAALGQKPDPYRQNMELDGPSFVAVTVQNVDKAAQWYSTILKLDLASSVDADDDRYRIRILSGNGMTIELIEQADATQPPATRQYGLFKFGFYVKDIGGFFNYLKTWQVDTDDTVFYDEALDAKSFGFIDLYGNRLQVFQRCDTFDC